MPMKKIISLFLSFLVALSAIAQEAGKMSVTSFELAENDNTANLSGTIVYDQNGDPCALIRVQTIQTGLSWDFGQMTPMQILQKSGEVWIYVPYGVKHVTVRHASFASLTYDFPMAVQKARTYIMALSVPLSVEAHNSQYVVFDITPKDADVVINKEYLEIKDGTAQRLMPYGIFRYSAFAEGYETLNGKVTVGPENENFIVVRINLQKTGEVAHTETVAKKQITSYSAPQIEYVDLGLSVLWGSCNLGASKPEETGNIFAWGETMKCTDSYHDSYKFFEYRDGWLLKKIIKYNTKKRFGPIDNKITLDPEDDVVNLTFGGHERIPTKEEFEELIHNCSWKITTLNGVKGWMATSLKPGFTDKWIFFENSVGFLLRFHSITYCNTSSLVQKSPENYYAVDFFISEKKLPKVSQEFRSWANFIRPVCDRQ